MSSLMIDPLEELAVLHQWYVKGVDQLQNQDPNDPLTTIKRPWIDEPSGSIPFDEQGGVALGAVGVTSIVLSFQVPQGFDGVIKYLSNNVNFGGFNNFSGDLIWQLTQNGRPIKNFSNILAEKGTIQQPRPISPIRLYAGDLVEWTVNHVANGALAGQIVCSLNGYIYPSKGVS